MIKKYDVHNVRPVRLSKQSEKFNVNKRRRNVGLAMLFFIGSISWGYDISRLSYASAFTISTIKVVGADSDITPHLMAVAYSSIEGDFYGLFPKSNALLYPKSSVLNALKKASPRIDSVAVGLDGFQGLKVTIKEKAPAAIVCASLPNVGASQNDNSGNCYFSDDTGTLYMYAPSFSSDMYNCYFIPDLDDNSTDQDDTGKSAVASTTFSVLQNFYEGVKKDNLDPSGILIKGGGEYELYIANPTSGLPADANATSTDTAVVYFNEQNGFDNELSNLIAFWAHMTDGARSKKQALNFDTIDLRYGSNVFYRISQ